MSSCQHAKAPKLFINYSFLFLQVHKPIWYTINYSALTTKHLRRVSSQVDCFGLNFKLFFNNKHNIFIKNSEMLPKIAFKKHQNTLNIWLIGWLYHFENPSLPLAQLSGSCKASRAVHRLLNMGVEWGFLVNCSNSVHGWKAICLFPFSFPFLWD